MRRNSFQFFGLPGSGKTTTFNKLLSLYPEKYISVPKFSKVKRFFLNTLFIFRFPGLSFSFFKLLIQNDKRIRKYIAHLISVSFANQMYINFAQKDKIYLTDEGVLQRLLSVAPKKFEEEEVIIILKKIKNLNTAVILMEGGSFSRFTTEPDRMSSARNKLGVDYLKEWSEDLKKNFELISSHLSENFIVYKGDSSEDINSKID